MKHVKFYCENYIECSSNIKKYQPPDCKEQCHKCMDVIIDFHFNKKTMKKLTFGQAIEALKLGQKVQREGWNGKGMHVYLEDHFKFITGNHEREYPPVLVLFTANGQHQAGWNASTPDVLAEDWSVVIS